MGQHLFPFPMPLWMSWLLAATLLKCCCVVVFLRLVLVRVKLPVAGRGGGCWPAVPAFSVVICDALLIEGILGFVSFNCCYWLKEQLLHKKS